MFQISIRKEKLPTVFNIFKASQKSKQKHHFRSKLASPSSLSGEFPAHRNPAGIPAAAFSYASPFVSQFLKP